MLSLASATTSFLAGGRAPTRPVTSHVSMAVAEPATKSELLYDLNEPVFPEVCEFAGVTLSRYVLEMAAANPDKPELVELVSVMTAVERACKTISSLVRRSPMSGLTGLEEGGGSINVQGEEQEDDPVAMEDDRAETYKWSKEVIVEESGKYVAVFDPLETTTMTTDQRDQW